MDKVPHLSTAKAYNAEWFEFFGKYENLTRDQIFIKGRQLGEKYGFKVDY